jgi:hypothetical protein
MVKLDIAIYRPLNNLRTLCLTDIKLLILCIENIVPIDFAWLKVKDQTGDPEKVYCTCCTGCGSAIIFTSIDGSLKGASFLF